MTTGIPHGPLSSADLPKLTGLSVLLSEYGTPEIVTFVSAPGDDLVSVRRLSGFNYMSPARFLTYLGERPEPGSPVILAPEGGWRENPVPGRMVEVTLRSGAKMVCKSDDIAWPFGHERHRASDIVAFSLIEDAKPERAEYDQALKDCNRLRDDGSLPEDDAPPVFEMRDGKFSVTADYLPADRPAQALSDLAGMDALAEAVHRGRFPDDREPTPFADEDAGGREYCYRIARSVAALSATPASPPAETGEGEPFAWFQMWNDGTRYPGDPKLWPPSKRDREYVEQMGRTIVPLYTHPASGQSDTERMRAALECFPVDADFANAEKFRDAVNLWWDTEARAALAEKEAGQ